MASIKIKTQKEKKIEVRRGEVYLIRFDPLKKGQFTLNYTCKLF